MDFSQVIDTVEWMPGVFEYLTIRAQAFKTIFYVYINLFLLQLPMDCLELIMEKLAGNPVQVQSTITQTVLHQTICLSQN
jgi:hypothetical protein